MRGAGRRKSPQRGAALLMAMLVVAVVSSMAAFGFWQQWRSWEVERMERDRAQADWLLSGALDWARLIVREDGRASRIDHLGEPWAVELKPTELRTFLAGKDADGLPADVTLAGGVQDLQGRLNWRNLVDPVGGSPRLSQPELRSFERLFDLLGLPRAELEAVAQGLLAASSQAQDALMTASRLDDLVAYGLTGSSLERLRSYTVLLDERTPLNVNTATATVLHARLEGADAAAVQQIVERRAQEPYRSVETFLAELPRGVIAPPGQVLSVASNYFLARGEVRMPALAIGHEAVLERKGVQVSVIQRKQIPIS